MIKVGATIEDNDLGMDKLIREIKSEAASVDIGVHADEDETLIKIAGANEFGATINHPGGTPYGYNSAEDAKNGKVKFLKKGAGYAVLGVTKPHIIKIPERSYIRSTMDENAERYLKAAGILTGLITEGEISKFEALERMGQLIESDIKQKMINLKSPANAASTIRKKKTNNPLINKGLLLGSIRYVIKAESEKILGGD